MVQKKEEMCVCVCVSVSEKVYNIKQNNNK